MRYLAFLPLIALMAPFGLANAQQATCERTVTADVVVIDQPMMFNRLGAQNVNGMMYALRSDVIDKTTRKPESVGGSLKPGKVELRPDKRPRPLVLRVRAGDCLEVKLENLLSFGPNPFNANPRVMTSMIRSGIGPSV